MKKTLVGGISALLLIGLPLGVQAQNETKIDTARATIDEWVQARKDIAKAESEWKVEKELILNQISLYEQTISELQDVINKAEAEATTATESRAKLNAEKESLDAAISAINKKISVYERMMHDAYAYFPEPLKDKVGQLYSSMPKEGQKNVGMPTSNRLAIVIGILNEADKFNKSITVRKEDHNIDGMSMEVDVVYFGLSMAIYSDTDGKNAGIGIPAKNGWSWEARNDKAVEIAKTIKVANDTLKPAVFTEVPMQITSVN
ncbi:MAG: DUF3450 family protein [Opitutales bacterium]|nr:DUF3450 family protein [Opitutales bacterium]